MTARPCAVSWCVLLAAGESKFCTIHAKYPSLPTDKATPDDHPGDSSLGKVCVHCDGEGEVHSRECGVCHGTGKPAARRAS